MPGSLPNTVDTDSSSELEISIERLAAGGMGVGHVHGKVFFIPLSAPGDKLRISVLSEKRSFSVGEILEVLSPSPHRINPPCSLFGRCGGCDWMHLSENCQIESKEVIIEECLQRIGGIDPPPVHQVISSPSMWNYRHKVHLKIGKGADGKIALGFHRRESHEIVPVHQCPVSSPQINRAIESLWEAMEKELKVVRSIASVSLCSCEKEKGVALILHLRKSFQKRQREMEKRLRSAFPSWLEIFPKYKRTIKGKREKAPLSMIIPSIPDDIQIAVDPRSFFQVNEGANRRLVSTVLAMAEQVTPRRVIDLHCGAGNFSLPLAAIASEVFGVDSDARAVAQARANALENGIERIAFYREDAASFLKGISSREQSIDLILIDPPRRGAKECLAGLLKISPRTIIYISCDPATLARDIKELVKGGYNLEQIHPVDMFPQTSQVEMAALLRR